MASDYVGKVDVKKKHYDMGILLTEEKKISILKEHFKKRVGYDLNIEEPRSFNEKIMWSKLYYQDPLITKCCDKFAVKEYVTETIGSQYIVPNIAQWDNPDDINFDELPDQFVLKVNWSSGYNIICNNKADLDQENTRRQLKKWMKPDRNAYYQFFNWGFKHMKPVVYAEKYIEQVDGQVYDYKFFVFDGKVEMLFIATDRSTKSQLTFDFFDRDFNPLGFTYGGTKHANPLPEKPKNFEKMIELAEKLAKPFPFVRVDFYEVGDEIMLGEMTFYSGGGLLPFDPVEWDYKIGEWYKLPEKLITDKPGTLDPVKIMFAKGAKTMKDLFRKVRSKICKHVVVDKVHYIILFNFLRFPLTIRHRYGKRYVRAEGMEIRVSGGESVKPVASTNEDINHLPAYKFDALPPRIAYAMEDKITMDMKKHYCEQKAYKQLKYFPNLDNPKTFNEKLLWLALYYKNPILSIACDKARVKDWVGERVGYEYVVPNIGNYTNVNDIDFDSLPDKFVIKANNGWGANEVILVNDKKRCDLDHLKALASTWLYPWSFYYYNNMCITDEKPERPLIVIEEFLEQEGKKYLDDYKLYVCNGKVKFSLVVNERGSKTQQRTFVDADWNVLPVQRAGKFSSDAPEKPDNYEKMVEIAEELCKEVPFARVDFYNLDGKIYVGEMTFTPGLFLRFNPDNADMLLGEYLDISELMENTKTGE